MKLKIKKTLKNMTLNAIINNFVALLQPFGTYWACIGQKQFHILGVSFTVDVTVITVLQREREGC
jgi:hypothetical protein